jgi:hypothetical protein
MNAASGLVDKRARITMLTRDSQFSSKNRVVIRVGFSTIRVGNSD